MTPFQFPGSVIETTVSPRRECSPAAEGYARCCSVNSWKSITAAVATFAGAPMLALGIAAPVAWAAPGTNCSGTCSVGGADGSQGNVSSNGKAQGGHIQVPISSQETLTGSGTVVTQGINNGTGHVTATGPISGSQSGNFGQGVGHCSGDAFTSFCTG